MRGTDGGLWRRICGMPALWVGILYDGVGIGCGLGPGQGLDGRRTPGLRDGVGRQAFKLPFRRTNVHEIAYRMLDISAAGLRRRAALWMMAA